MIAGRWTVEDGQPVGVDVARLRAEHGAAARRYLEKV
jgi:8-oxoguanine deaminase